MFKGHFTAYLKDDPENILLDMKNVEVISGGWLIAWAMASAAISSSNYAGGSTPIPYPDYPIWGLALGNKDFAGVYPNDDIKKQKTLLENEFMRKSFSSINFLKPEYLFPVSGPSQKVPDTGITPFLEVQTLFNSNTDTLLSTEPLITEMGLVGGSTSVLVPVNNIGLGGGDVRSLNQGILLDYINPESFKLPLGRDVIISVLMDFSH